MVRQATPLSEEECLPELKVKLSILAIGKVLPEPETQARYSFRKRESARKDRTQNTTTVVYGGAVCTLCQWPPVPLRDFGPRTLSFLGLKSRNQPMLRDLAPSMLRPLGLRSRNRPERAVPYCLGIAVIDVVLSQEMITPEGTAPTHFPHYRTCPITCPITRKDLIVIVSNRSGNMFTMGACVCRR